MAGFIGFAAAFAYSAGAVVCHQLPERSFALAGRQLPVCARCSGLYLGVALGLLGWFLVRRLLPVPLAGSRRLLAGLAIAAVPTTVSWVTGVLGIWDGTNVIRAVLALPLGLGAGAVVAAVAAKDLR
ncbi:MAG: DUF2085 domain-containing protein [Vicinamibacterales bacterium]